MSRPALEEPQLAELAALGQRAVDETCRVYVGPRAVPEHMMIALLSRGHVLLEGVPGVAKTTLAHAFAETIGASMRRVQFTPDLLPSDITGTFVLSPRDGSFSLRHGPVFSHVLLGDEINRAPARTQSALLEAMQERQVSIEGESYPLPDPFLVLATQNPAEHAGTYPLPEAQVDRFRMRLVLGYPSERDERAVLARFLGVPPVVRPVLDVAAVRAMQAAADRVHVEPSILDYVVRLVGATRQHPKVALGASPRAGLGLLESARARALLAGRGYALPDDVKALAVPVLAHRLALTPAAELSGAGAEAVVHEALARVALRPA